MSLRDRLREDRSARTKDRLYDRFGVLENPFPAANQTTNNPHFSLPEDDEAERSIVVFLDTSRSQVVVIEGTQGVGKTNFLNHWEDEIQDARREMEGYYVVRYLADPEASFEGTTRRIFEELGTGHLGELAKALRMNKSPIEEARSQDMRTALRRLAKTDGENGEAIVKSMMEWLLGYRLLKTHRISLGVQFRLDTVESKTVALRDLVQVSGEAGVLKGIFLLLDELEKQGGVLGQRAVIRYLSALRAVVDALPKGLFLMIAITPDALERYSYALPALRSRLENRIVLQPLKKALEAHELADFYVELSRQGAKRSRSGKGGKERIVDQRDIEDVYRELANRAEKRGDQGVRQREFLHRLHELAENTLRKA